MSAASRVVVSAGLLAPAGAAGAVAARMLLAWLAVLCWIAAGFVALRHPPLPASALLLALLLLFWEVHGRRALGMRGTVEAGRLSLRHLRDLLPGLAPALPALLLFCLALAHLHDRLLDPAPRPAAALYAHEAEPWGVVPVFLITAVFAPTVEEFGFRGWIQAALAGRWHPLAGLIAASAAFGVAHAIPDRTGYFFVLGLVLGHATLATRCIHAGLVLHAFLNGALLALKRLFPAAQDPAWVDTLRFDLLAGGVLLASSWLLLRTTRRLAPPPGAAGPARVP